MSQRILLDTGPLVAFLKRKDSYHTWATKALRAAQYPYITCEPVLTEALFLLSNTHAAKATIFEMIENGVIQTTFRLENNANALNRLMARYESVPMSLADACLVRMAELNRSSSVMTLNSDFQIYRMNRDQMIPVVMPEI